jgi:Protein of unknown function (DUF1566)
MRLFTGIVLLMVLCQTAAGGSKQRQCVRACAGSIAACTSNATERGFGDLRRGCRAAVLKQCKRKGPAACNARCGDGAVQHAEECDGSDLAGRSCASLGFSGGTLACTSSCTLDLTGCSVGGAFLGTGQTTTFTPGDDGSLQRGAILRYRDNGDGTITDANTSLMWEKKVAEQGLHFHDNHFVWTPGPGSVWDWVASLNAENGGAGFANHTDWRLPNLRELQSIVDYQNSAPAVASEFNTACTPGCGMGACSCTEPSNLWTSTTFMADSTLAWWVDFANGFVGTDAKTAAWHARAVRGP